MATTGVDISALCNQIAAKLLEHGGVKSATGDEGSTTMFDPVDQLMKLDELASRQRKRSCPKPKFSRLQTQSDGLDRCSRRFNRL